eukprot:m.779250 g.779250  ORF g.779250 m.779250 type:complete len:626 (-) comp59131_c0_seq1:112-1989(-)
MVVVGVCVGVSRTRVEYAPTEPRTIDPVTAAITSVGTMRWPQEPAGAEGLPNALLYQSNTDKTPLWGWSAVQTAGRGLTPSHVYIPDIRQVFRHYAFINSPLVVNHQQQPSPAIGARPTTTVPASPPPVSPYPVVLPSHRTCEQVLKDFFAAVFNHVMRSLMQATGRNDAAFTQQIHWTFTVPANWNEAERHSFQMIIQKTGVIRTPSIATTEFASVHRPVFVFESEAALVSSLNQQQFRPIHERIRPGDLFGVAFNDGTQLDLTVRMLTTDALPPTPSVASSLQTGYIATEAPVGSSVRELVQGSTVTCEAIATLEDRFLDFLRSKFKSFGAASRNQKHMAKLRREWLNALRTYDGLGEAVEIEIPGTMREEVLRLQSLSGAATKVANEDEEDVLLSLSRADFLHIVEPVFAEIEARLRPFLAAQPGMRILVLIGAIARYPALANRLQTALSSVRMLVHTDVGDACTKGCLLIGINPAVIASRCVRFSYGISSGRLFIEGQDPVEYLVTVGNDKKYCKNIFDTMISAGTEIFVNQALSKSYKSASYGQDISIPIFRATAKHPPFVTSESVEEAAKICVKEQQYRGFGAGGFEFHVFCGQVIFEVVIVDQTTSQKLLTTLGLSVL